MTDPFSDKHTVVISPRSIIFGVFFILSLYFLYKIQSILVLILFSFIITVALNPLVRFCHRRLHIPKTFSIVIAYIVFLTFLSGLVALIVPTLAVQVQQLFQKINIPLIQDEIRNINFTLQEWDTLFSRIGDSAGLLLNIINSTFNGVFTVFTLIVLSFYLMHEREKLHKKITWFTKDEVHLKKTKDFIDSVEHQLGGWVRGEAILMFAIGSLTYLGLTLLSIPYALPLALLAGMLEILPSLGPTIAAIPAIFVAFITFGPMMGLIVTLFAIVVQQLENNFLVPKIMNDNAHVSPLVSIIAILVGFSLGGVVGGLLAIPIYITVRAAYSHFLKPESLK